MNETKQEQTQMNETRVKHLNRQSKDLFLYPNEIKEGLELYNNVKKALLNVGVPKSYFN